MLKISKLKRIKKIADKINKQNKLFKIIYYELNYDNIIFYNYYTCILLTDKESSPILLLATASIFGE